MAAEEHGLSPAEVLFTKHFVSSDGFQDLLKQGAAPVDIAVFGGICMVYSFLATRADAEAFSKILHLFGGKGWENDDRTVRAAAEIEQLLAAVRAETCGEEEESE